MRLPMVTAFTMGISMSIHRMRTSLLTQTTRSEDTTTTTTQRASTAPCSHRAQGILIWLIRMRSRPKNGLGMQAWGEFAIVCCRIGRTKLLRSVGSNSQTNKHLLLQTTFRAQRALPEFGAKGTAPSVTQRCWQSLADAAWNYPVERESHR